MAGAITDSPQQGNTALPSTASSGNGDDDEEQASELPWSSPVREKRSSSLQNGSQHPGNAESLSSSRRRSPPRSSNTYPPVTETAGPPASTSTSWVDPDQINLQTRPASFAGAPASTRQPAMLQLLDPTPSTSKLPYNGGNLNHRQYPYQQQYNGNGSNQMQHQQGTSRSTPNTANPLSSSSNNPQRPYMRDPTIAEEDEASSTMRRGRGDSNSSSGSETQPLSQLLNGRRSGPRRSRSAERDNSSQHRHHHHGSPHRNNDMLLLHPGGSSSSNSLLPPAHRTESRDSNRSKSSSGSSGNGRSNNGISSRPPEGGGGGRSKQAQQCAKCGQPMTGQFVRALGTVFHLDCFRCQDCNKVVAAKFFPVDGADGRQYPLCETDYFRRLSLICAKCGAALRGSYITALDMKFHTEHFTCSVCPTIFGPHDSYYEHGGQVYCHFHYSTRFAVKCTGCKTAILKQFVEINRNNVDEHWHPECYMIHKFWNIKLVPSSKRLTDNLPSNQDEPSESPPKSQFVSGSLSDWSAQERKETAQSLREKQKYVEAQVYRIWTVLSTFEESSAACISEMLRHVSNGHYLDGVKMAERFVMHVETLFAAIDDLSSTFRHAGGKEIPHVREARMLCKKVVNFFSLLSHTHETGARKMGITQELLSLVTGLAHYLKILIRIALTSALKLERDHSSKNSLSYFLARLDRLCKDPDSLKAAPSPTITGPEGSRQLEPSKSRQYGYKSLTRSGGSFTGNGQGDSITDLCERCRLTVEEECVRFGTNLRWHLQCLCCSVCQRHASKDREPPKEGAERAIYLKEFRMESFDHDMRAEDARPIVPKGSRVFCSECPSGSIQEGFEYVTRLEQYAFLLCVALNKLYRLLKQRGVMPSSSADGTISPSSSSDERSIHEAYRDSSDIKRMKTVNLDRKVSTTARVAQRSTVVESPSGRIAQTEAGQSKQTDILRLAQENGATVHGAPSQVQQSMVGAGRIQQQQQDQPIARQMPPPTSQPISSVGIQQYQPAQPPSRPSYHRTTTAIRVVDDQPQNAHGVLRDSEGLGSERSPVQDEDGITLADLHQVMEAEQAREQGGHLARNSHSQLLSELSALEYFIVKHAAAITLASDLAPFGDLAQLDELLDIIDAKKNNFWGKLFKGNSKDKKEIKKKGVFGVPLEVLVERHGTDSMLGAGPGSVRVPTFVDDVITSMKQMDLSVEGIFRKNGNIRRLKELADAIDRDPGSVNLADDNPVQIAALLKKFLRDLPDPLLTFRLQHLWLATQRIDNLEDRKKALHLICCLMPKHHRDIMEVLFVFLKWVASFSHVDEETGSKMDLQNLATVICPNILYSKGKDPSKDESFLGIQTVAELLIFQDELFTVPDELVAILSDQELFLNPAELSSKDILKKAEYHLKERQRGRGRASPGEQHNLYRPAHRGEVKQTHPHFHAGAFSPPTFPHQNIAMLSPQHERPLSWQHHRPHQAYPPSDYRHPNLPEQHVLQQNYQTIISPTQGNFGQPQRPAPSPRLQP